MPDRTRAQRARDYRARRRRGERLSAPVRVSPRQIAGFAKSRYLPAGEQSTRQDIRDAIEAFIADHLP